MSTTAQAWFFDAPGKPLTRRELQLPDPAAGQALVEVLACGLCHTDLGFYSGSVPTRHALPLVLGHEVVGRNCATGSLVIVPAVLPCGRCAYCAAGRGNACPDQQMPGNDIHGGFATHLLVPAAPLVPLPTDMKGPADHLDPRLLAVVADAVSTAYQAVRRSGLVAGDVAVVVGAGGVGGYVAQIAAALGARVLALDIAAARLELLRSCADIEPLGIAGLDERTARSAALAALKRADRAPLHWRIFECSGTVPGQSLAFSLIQRGATLVQVGYTPAKLELRLSNLMAHDATVHGTWGCPPAAYPRVLELIASGRVQLAPFCDFAPMSQLDRLLDDMAHHRLEKRMVLDPTA